MILRVFHFSLLFGVVERVVVWVVHCLCHVDDLLGVSGGGLSVVPLMLLVGERPIQAGRRACSSRRLPWSVCHRRADNIERLLLKLRRLNRLLNNLRLQPEMAWRLLSNGILYWSPLRLALVLPFILRNRRLR